MQLVRAIRRAYRRELVRQEAAGQTPTLPDPFTPQGAEQLVEFLREPSRYLYEVYRERPELHSAFPDVPGTDTRRFVDWVRQDGEEIHEELLPGRQPLARGVNLYGYVFAESGTGQIGRSIVAALQAAEIPHAVIPFVETVNRQQHAFASDANAIYDTNLICVNADQVPVFLEQMGAETLERRYNIGVWAWEVDDMPESMARNGDYFDEVWGISDYTAEGLRRRVRVPVRAFPLPVVTRPVVVRSRQELGLPEGFLALFCFDFGSIFDRKNPLAVVEAFRRAFPKPDEAQLCIKTVNGDRHARDLQRLRDACADRNDIVLIDGYRSAEEQMALMQSCDVYISLHRAEGFGLTVAEAMALGKPVITTAWSSTMEFTTEENSYLVPANVIPVPKGTPVYPSTARWADPDVERRCCSAAARVRESRRSESDRRTGATRYRGAAQRRGACAPVESNARTEAAAPHSKDRTAADGGARGGRARGGAHRRTASGDAVAHAMARESLAAHHAPPDPQLLGA